MSVNRLTLAVPRGALMRETLDLLDRLGVDTSEVRANDRKLLFEHVGIVTTPASSNSSLRSFERTSAVSTPRRSSRSSVSPSSAPRGTAIRSPFSAVTRAAPRR